MEKKKRFMFLKKEEEKKENPGKKLYNERLTRHHKTQENLAKSR